MPKRKNDAIDILIVEDNTDSADSLKMMLNLTRPNWRVDIADNGVAAIRMVRNKHYDIILLDLGLPGLTGQKVISELVKSKVETHIVVLSNSGDAATIVECLILGACDFLTKPASPESLLITIERAMLLEPSLSEHEAAHLLVNKVNQLRDDVTHLKETNEELERQQKLWRLTRSEAIAKIIYITIIGTFLTTLAMFNVKLDISIVLGTVLMFIMLIIPSSSIENIKTKLFTISMKKGKTKIFNSCRELKSDFSKMIGNSWYANFFKIDG